jgi:hypothetical protein
MDTEKLDELIAAVEAGEWIDMTPAYVSLGVNATVAARAYTGSLDAALALHEALLPGWRVNIGQTEIITPDRTFTAYVWPNDATMRQSVFRPCATHATPARAWILAILKAYRAQVPYYG